MFIGFIPFLIIAFAALLSLNPRRQQAARALWLVSMALIVIWTVFHGTHHLPMLRTLSAW